MRFKYKTGIICITMCLLFVGLLIFSVNIPAAGDSKKNKDEEVIAKVSDKDKEENTEWSGDGQIKVNEHPQINKLVEEYLEARVEGDEEKLKTLISGTNTLDLEQFRKKAEYIERYDNIECYTAEGPVEGIYLVYVYEEVKISGIDTLAPSMIRILVSLAEDGKPYVYFGTINDEMIEFMNKVAESDEVKELTKKVNLKLEEAETKDADLKQFNENLKAAAKLAEEKSKVSDEVNKTLEPSIPPKSE